MSTIAKNKLRWQITPRATDAARSDTRKARLARVRRHDGSIVEYRIEPTRDTYRLQWTISCDGTPIASARTAVMAMQTVERGVAAAGRVSA